MRRLRFAVLFDSDSLEGWHLLCLRHLEQVAELAGVIVTPAHANAPSRRAASSLMRAYARRVDKRSTLQVAQQFADVPKFSTVSAHASVEPAAFDFVLKLGRGSIPAGFDSAARHGVWYFEHELESDLLPFFREVYEGEDVTPAALLASPVGEGEPMVLEQGYFRTEKRSYVATRDRVLDGIAAWPARACRRLVAGTETERRAKPVRLPRRRPQRRSLLLPFVARLARRRLAFARDRLFRHPQWNIGVLEAPLETVLVPGAYDDDCIDWLPLDGRGGFLADPFAVVRDGTLHVLCEYFDYRDGKGHICTLDLSANGVTRPTEPAIRPPCHSSYPFLLESAGEIYCIPETADANEVALYRATDFPRRWSKQAVLLEGLAGVDPTVFHHDGRWWLLCTKKGSREDVELWAWHAPELLGPWTPHAANPVKTDVRGARPAGSPFVYEGALYRPAQDCSRTYGWRIAVQRVTLLTPTAFVEERVTVLEASPRSPFPRARHTLTIVGDLVLIDGRRDVFVWPAFRAFLRIWAADLTGKVRRA